MFPKVPKGPRRSTLPAKRIIQGPRTSNARFTRSTHRRYPRRVVKTTSPEGGSSAPIVRVDREEGWGSGVGKVRFPRHYTGVALVPELIECSVCWQVGILAGRHESRRKERGSRREVETGFSPGLTKVCVRCGRDIGPHVHGSSKPCTCHFRWPCHSAPSSLSRIPFF